MYGRILFPVAESVDSITVVDLTCPVVRRSFLLSSSRCTLPARRCFHVEVGGTEARNTRRQYDWLSHTHWRWFLQRVDVHDDGSPLFIEDCLTSALWKIFSARATINVSGQQLSRSMRMVLALVIVKALVPPVGSLWAIRFHWTAFGSIISLCFTGKETSNVESGASHLRRVLPTNQREYVEPPPVCCRPFHEVQGS